MTKSLKQFANPPKEYSVLPWWFLNHDLEEKELAWQIKEFKDKGMDGLITYSRNGLLNPYMSKEFLARYNFIVKEAKRNGLYVYLDDEESDPSGMANGKVIFEHPEYIARGLDFISKEVNPGENICLKLGKGQLIGAYAVRMRAGAFSEKDIIDITDAVGPMRDKWNYSFWDSRYYYPIKKVCQHYRGMTFNSNYYLRWTAPENSGRWFVVGVIAKEFRENHVHWSAFADQLNEDAIDYYIDCVHNQYKKTFGQDFSKTVKGIFTDEAKMVMSFPWTAKLPEMFSKKFGYDIGKVLPALKYNFGTLSVKARNDYRQLCAEKFKVLFEKMNKWCKDNGIDLIGHVSPEEDIYVQVPYLGNIFPMFKDFGVPGCDIIIPRVGDRENTMLNACLKVATSASEQFGKERILCEALSCGEWSFTLEDAKWATDWLYTQGINMLVAHNFSYSIDSFRKYDCPPSHFYQATFWEYYKNFTEYGKRLSYALSGGRTFVNIAFMWNIRTMWAVYPDDKRGEGLRDEMLTLSDYFYRAHRNFHYFDEDNFGKAAIKGKQLRFSGFSYECVVIPPCVVIAKSAFRKIAEFARKGGTVIFCGELAGYYEDGTNCVADIKRLLSERKQNAFHVEEKFNYLKQDGCVDEGIACSGKGVMELSRILSAVERDVKIEGAGNEDLMHIHKTKKDAEIYFFCNTAKSQRNVLITLKGKGHLNRYDVSTGKVYSYQCIKPVKSEISNTKFQNPNKNGKVSFRYIFPPKQSALFVLEGKPAKEKEPCLVQLKTTTLKSDFSFRTEKDNVLVLKNWQAKWKGSGGKWVKVGLMPAHRQLNIKFKKMIEGIFDAVPEDDEMEPVDVEYRTVFFCRDSINTVRLVSEKSTIVGDYQVFINGKKTGDFRRTRIYDCLNMETQIGKHLKKGANEIRVVMSITDPLGGLIEPMRIYGRFSVKKTGGEMFALAKEVTRMSSTWTENGYPFYSGKGIYSAKLKVEKENVGDIIKLRLDGIADFAQVKVNGKDCGVVLWHPYEIDITDKIRRGNNTLEIGVVNSVQNVLYGWKRRSGLFGKVKIIHYRQDERHF